ncbi:PDZ domain-containing protein [candidate division KSB1 bacterium]
MLNTEHISDVKKRKSVRFGYKLIITIDLVILALIIIFFLYYLSDSDTQQNSLNPQAVSPTLSLDQSQEAIPWLGLDVIDVTTEIAIKAGLDKVKGALVQSFIYGSPVCKAGMKPGDIIVSLNGRVIRTAKEFQNDVSGLEVGSEIDMCVAREDYRTTLNVVVEPAPDWFTRENKISPWLGVEVSEVSEKDKKNLEDNDKDGGVLVKKVFPGSPADKAGIEPDDVIMSFNYRKMRTVREFLTDLRGTEVGDRIRICFIREDIRKTVYPIVEKRPQTAPETFVSESFTQDQIVVND